MVIEWSKVMERRGFFGTIGRHSRGLVFALPVLLSCAGAGAGWAQDVRAATAAMRDQAQAVIERHCARCHQSGRLASEAPQGVTLDIPLDDVVREGMLVKPGLPEASALFNVLYTGHAPGGLFAKGSSGEPAADEIAAVRDWIVSLDEDRAGVCKDRRRLGPAHATAAVGQAIETSDRNRRRSLRFVSLAHLADSCRTAAELAGYVEAIKTAVKAVGRASAPLDPRVIDGDGSVLELELERLGWDAQGWERLTARFPLAGLPPFELGAELSAELGTRHAIVSADWLAWAISEPATFAVLAGLAGDSAQPAESPLSALAQTERVPIAALAALYARPVAARVAAAETGLTPQQLDQQLQRIGGAAAFSAQRLRQGAVPRSEALGVYAALLEGGPGGRQETIGDSPSSQPRIAVWADADSYASGQVLSLKAETTSACNLTLINVDARGRATVLFPNGFEPDNLLQPGRRITVPGVDAPYRFRLLERGREKVIAICTATARPIDGIRHDFDRLHFTVLGEWLGFQIRSYEDVGKPAPRVRERRQVRRRGQPAAPVLEAAPRGSEVQARSALTIDVR